MNKEFWKNAGIRATKTVAQSLVAAIGVGAAISEVDWMHALSIALVAGLASVLTSLASLDVISDGSTVTETEETTEEEGEA